MIRWSDGQIVRFNLTDYQIVRWSDYHMVRWSDGQIFRWSSQMVRISLSDADFTVRMIYRLQNQMLL